MQEGQRVAPINLSPAVKQKRVETAPGRFGRLKNASHQEETRSGLGRTSKLSLSWLFKFALSNPLELLLFIIADRPVFSNNQTAGLNSATCVIVYPDFELAIISNARHFPKITARVARFEKLNIQN